MSVRLAPLPLAAYQDLTSLLIRWIRDEMDYGAASRVSARAPTQAPGAGKRTAWRPVHQVWHDRKPPVRSRGWLNQGRQHLRDHELGTGPVPRRSRQVPASLRRFRRLPSGQDHAGVLRHHLLLRRGPVEVFMRLLPDVAGRLSRRVHEEVSRGDSRASSSAGSSGALIQRRTVVQIHPCPRRDSSVGRAPDSCSGGRGVGALSRYRWPVTQLVRVASL